MKKITRATFLIVSLWLLSGMANAALAPPTNVTASQGTYKGYVKISWSASSGVAGSMGGYAIYADNSDAECGWWSGGDLSGICSTADGEIHSYTVKEVVNNTYSLDSVAATGFGDISPMAAPTNVTASQGTYNGAIKLTWSASPDLGYGNYAIFDSDGNQCGNGSVGSDGPWLFGFCDVSDASVHSYRVAAYSFSSNQYGNLSMPATGFAYIDPSEAAQITNFSASQGTVSGGVQLTWSVTQGQRIDEYYVERDGTEWLGSISSEATSFTDYVTDESNHSYTISFITPLGRSEPSSPITGFAGTGKAKTTYVYRVKI